MKRIEVRLSVSVVAPLLDVIREMANSLSKNLAVPLKIDDLDEVIREAWVKDLQREQNADLEFLLRLFDEEFFRDGAIQLDEDTADRVIRACAAVRLRLRSERLPDLDDAMLESADVAMNELPKSRRNVFLCYIFLATLQELIIQDLEMGESKS
ncbi:MAG: hypothetical protein CMI16_15125 [Opitutaceae bacterium]|nr:hypothetical protein [Opitutaceae bacterium]